MKFLRSLIKSFGHAFSGIAVCIKNQQNFRIHLVAGVLVVGFGILYGLSPTEWAVVVTVIGGVIASEMMNTAIEAAIDRTGPHRDQNGKTAKDASAGATLVMAIVAVIIAFFIFSDTARLIPALLRLFTTWRCLLFLIYVVVSLLFIIGKKSTEK